MGSPLTIWEADDSIGDRSLPSPTATVSHHIDIQRPGSATVLPTDARLDSPAASTVVQSRPLPRRASSSSSSKNVTHSNTKQVAHLSAASSVSSVSSAPTQPQPQPQLQSPPHEALTASSQLDLNRLTNITSAGSTPSAASFSSPKPGGTARASPSPAALTSTLTLSQLLSDSRLFPLNQSEFRRFLVRCYVDELLEFLLTLRSYKADLTALQLKAAKLSAGPVLCMEEKRRLIEVKDGLLRRFICVGSERELNLSERLRQQLLAANDDYHSRYIDNDNIRNFSYYDFTHHRDLPILLSLFDEAELEVIKLLEQGSYVALFYQQQTRNIDAGEISFRRNQGIALLLLSLIITLVLLLTVQARWYRLFIVAPLFVASTSLLTAHCGVCPMLQLQGLLHHPTLSQHGTAAQVRPALPVSIVRSLCLLVLLRSLCYRQDDSQRERGRQVQLVDSGQRTVRRRRLPCT